MNIEQIQQKAKKVKKNQKEVLDKYYEENIIYTPIYLNNTNSFIQF